MMMKPHTRNFDQHSMLSPGLDATYTTNEENQSFADPPTPVENEVNQYLENKCMSKGLPISMILKSKSPFTKDKAICKTHQKPLIYICEDHNDEDEIWCEDCTPNPHCAVINMK